MYVGDLKFDKNKKLDFSRTAEEIIDSGEHWGCHEQGLVAATLLRARGYPTTYITAFLKEDLESYDGEENLHRRGHIFLRVTMPDGRRQLTRLNGEFIDKIPEEYVFGAEGLDADDIGLRTQDDYQELFLKTKENITPNYPKVTEQMF